MLPPIPVPITAPAAQICQYDVDAGTLVVLAEHPGEAVHVHWRHHTIDTVTDSTARYIAAIPGSLTTRDVHVWVNHVRCETT